MLPKKRPPTHPGEMLLKEFLEPKNISQKAFAKYLGWTYARLNEIIHGKRNLTAESVLCLAEAFNMEPEFWLHLQKNWDLWQANQHHRKLKPLKLFLTKKLV